MTVVVECFIFIVFYDRLLFGLRIKDGSVGVRICVGNGVALNLIYKKCYQ